MANQDIRNTARARGVFIWQLALYFGVSAPTMTRWLRCELSDEKKAEYFKAIEAIATEHIRQATDVKEV